VHRPARDSIATAHDAGLEVLAWCPDPDVARELAAAGVDALVLNDVPTAVLAVRAGW
jgi:glycerophosphoryl diester phosphodiesterase